MQILIKNPICFVPLAFLLNSVKTVHTVGKGSAANKMNVQTKAKADGEMAFCMTLPNKILMPFRNGLGKDDFDQNK